ncbi:MAG TPA: ATP-binding cassette domain-containing protein, partial [Thermodesulfovibrionales bacterium]|nr:ATP-binding cassette domain-containing protein [Thermodesulfovibrionales bacterium]
MAISNRHREENEPLIAVEGVSVRYRLAKEKPRTLQEYFIDRLRGKKVNYEAFWALKDITITLGKGETLGVIGHNGAGKSTLLKVIAGVLKPTEGKVAVRGKVAPLIELGAGFDMELTGLENIYMNGSILGLSRKEIERKFDKIVAFSELAEFIYSPLKSYSSGMIARL